MTTPWRSGLKAVIPILLLTYPFLIGLPLLSVIHSSVIFYCSSILPQILIWPYLSYYNDAFERPFHPAEVAVTVIHWSIVLAIYFYTTRRASLAKSLASFLLIAALSMVAAHLLLIISGYRLSVEWL